MSLIAIGLNLTLAVLLMAALALGLRLNGRLKQLRDGQEGFARSVRELDTAATRAEQGLADLRAATDEATDILLDRIENGRALASRLERLYAQAPAPRAIEPDPVDERRLGALLAAAREGRARPVDAPPAAPPPLTLSRVVSQPDEDLFVDPPVRAVAMGR